MPALYDPAGLPALEAMVHAQCKDGSYDLDNNLAVLKLYQFHPEKSNSAVVARILVKALMHLPETDYLMCTYLIPEAVQEETLIANIGNVATLLETCAFRSMWKALEPLEAELLAHVPGFAEAVREFALHTMQMTYQTVPESHVRESLNVDAAQLQKLLQARGWTLEGGVVKLTLNDDNTAKPKKPDEAAGGVLQFNQLSKLLSSTFGLY